MAETTDLNEAYHDSPWFRLTMKQEEARCGRLTSKLTRVATACGAMHKQSTQYSASVQSFLGSLRDVSSEFSRDDRLVQDGLQRFCDALEDLEQHRSLLLEQAKATVADSLVRFVQQDIAANVQQGRARAKMGDDLDQARSRYAAAAKSRPADCIEAKTMLTATQTCYTHAALDHALNTAVLKNKARLELGEKLLAYMYSQFSYFLQGWDLLKDLEPYMKSVAEQLGDASTEAGRIQHELEEASSAIRVSPPQLVNKDGTISQGYLFKRSHGAFRSWSLHWFVLDDSGLRFINGKDGAFTVLVHDMRLCTVKLVPSDSVDRQFVFELVTPTTNYLLQAESGYLMDAWALSLQRAVGSALKTDRSLTRQQSSQSSLTPAGSEPGSRGSREPSQSVIRTMPGNDVCCDCDAADPTWASINLGCTLCIECSGVHRSLGTHVSKVRSLTLDKLPDDVTEVMKRLGNISCREVFEAGFAAAKPPVKRIRSDASRADRETQIRAKYVEKKFVVAGVDPPSDEELLAATSRGDAKGVLELLAKGCNIEATNADKCTSLMLACKEGDTAVSSLLLLNHAKVNAQDNQGRTALHHAVIASDPRGVCLLLKYRAVHKLQDSEGKTALQLALELRHGDMVTLLRLAEVEGATGSDDWMDMADFDGTAAPAPEGYKTV
eukprot:m.489618 g.489618  ORF g.489618 m.489618 type:complete len:666 (-) comp26930_c0_seq1:75-2072(-)